MAERFESLETMCQLATDFTRPSSKREGLVEEGSFRSIPNFLHRNSPSLKWTMS